ncbi:unnamed protein product [Prorocentrum cordatum]|uniref:Uncharacterized protein n=1 Tax=Prorocentrum cordatum TaxID=2364126 RepID=A0ABN9TQ60_9DINO|nr:unnamed protein product [Polarella glacialis]
MEGREEDEEEEEEKADGQANAPAVVGPAAPALGEAKGRGKMEGADEEEEETVDGPATPRACRGSRNGHPGRPPRIQKERPPGGRSIVQRGAMRGCRAVATPIGRTIPEKSDRLAGRSMVQRSASSKIYIIDADAHVCTYFESGVQGRAVATPNRPAARCQKREAAGRWAVSPAGDRRAWTPLGVPDPRWAREA